jgi:AraC-like DNA-binding protein
VFSYREIPPHARLRPLIQSYWILEHSGEQATPQRVVPDGHPELILNMGQPFEVFREGQWQAQRRCFLAGQIDGPLLLRPGGRAHILGIRFHPEGAARLFNTPVDELTGQFAALSDLSPTLAEACGQALAGVEPDLAAIEAALFSAAERSRFADAAISEGVRRITRHRGATNLSRLARELNLSLRQFERRFVAAVGLPPKLFCRMQRFVQVFRVMSEPNGNWVDAALACGYYDQSHLIRDCKRLAGETPAALLADDADLARHFLHRFGMSHSSKTTPVPLD